MDEDFLEYPAWELIQKFGAGSHKPGSGSAAALQGMLSAQLVLTVIDRTLDKDRYSKIKSQLISFQDDINARIYPALDFYFGLDSEQFHKHMEYRLAKINERNPFLKRELQLKSLEELVPATEIIIEIARNCVQLAEYTFFIFDNAFKAVRGDSGVAMELAVSALAGCISIVDLNLLSFTSNDWTTYVREEINEIRGIYIDYSSQTSNKLNALRVEVDEHFEFQRTVLNLINNAQGNSVVSNDFIEKTARDLQNALWKYRKSIWKNNIPESPIEVIRPETALSVLGYLYKLETTLGQHTTNGQLFEVAGIIDTSQKVVSISEKFRPKVRNFTAAHELGHAMFHKNMVLHRDRPKDGSSPLERDPLEKQADKFASYFLMPESLVKPAFIRRFKVDVFVINEDSAFAFNERNSESLRKKSIDFNGLAKLLAQTKFYDSTPFESLADMFQVSVEAMAFRLEELQLLEF